MRAGTNAGAFASVDAITDGSLSASINAWDYAGTKASAYTSNDVSPCASTNACA